MNEKIEFQEKKTFRVVAALIRDNNKILLSQRWPSKHFGLIWEFPGGKVENDETDEQALKRELQEELNIEVNVGTCCFETFHGYGGREVHLLIYRCKIVSGEPKPCDVKAVEWVDLQELPKRNFPPADIPFINELAAGSIKEEDNDVDDDEDEIEFKPAQVIRRIDTTNK